FLNYGAEVAGEAESRSHSVKLEEGVKGRFNDAYTRLKKTLLNDADLLNISRLNLAKLAAKHGGPPVGRGQSVLIDAVAPAAGDEGGFLRLANTTGRTLTNCTLQLS